MKNLKASVQEYLNVRRSLGYKLKNIERVLFQFVKFLKKNKTPFITTSLAFDWATSSGGVLSSTHAGKLSIVRLFAEFRKITDPRTEIPPNRLLPYKPKRAMPHIYSKKEIVALLGALLNNNSSELRRQTQYTIFGLFAVTGCRAQEVLSLKMQDVNLTQGYLTIRNAKFGKSRIVPLHSTTVQALKRYAKVRNLFFQNAALNTFFVSSKGNPLDYGDFKRTFIKLSKKIGLRKIDENHGPRIHDLRHTFAVKTILSWYKKGVNVETHIPLLSTYLGHIKPSNTYWYLTGVPELLAQASKRLDNIRR